MSAAKSGTTFEFTSTLPAETFRKKALVWADQFEHFAFLNYKDSNFNYGGYAPFPCMLAAGSKRSLVSNHEESFAKLKKFQQENPSWLVGYFGYDLKNDIENLTSKNPDQTLFPDLFFFEPEHILVFTSEGLTILTDQDSEAIVKAIEKTLPSTPPSPVLSLKQNISKEEYLQNVQRIKTHLLEGDIYELNYCLEFFSNNSSIDPIDTFARLCDFSPMPFSCILKNKDQFLLSASPERFLKRAGSTLISQPMKGTSRRSKDPDEDKRLKENLTGSEKERAENMMIVDLVRNDLAKSSVPGTVKVDELFNVYSLTHLHQMISTVTSQLKDQVDGIDAIRNAFPMGSMTGAPKIRAMQLIDEYEKTKRGLFSGAAGFFTPEKDFDFNVVIRSILYNQTIGYLSFQAGSAITYDSDPETEYQECLLKAEAIKHVLLGQR